MGIHPDMVALWLDKINSDPEFVKRYKESAIRLAKIMECYVVNGEMMKIEPDAILKYVNTILYWAKE